jgi:hypothetical protein
MQQQVVLLTRDQQILQARLGEPLEAWLRRRYLDDKLTLREMAAEIGFGVPSLSRWLRQFAIEARRQGRPS